MTKRIAIAELEGVALDWAVGKAAGFNVSLTMAYPSDGKPHMAPWDNDENRPCNYSRSWKQCGPLIERYGMFMHKEDVIRWAARTIESLWHEGKTPLIAACRAIVAAHNPSGFVEVPDELVEGE